MKKLKPPVSIKILMFIYYFFTVAIMGGYLVFLYAAWGAENNHLNAFQTTFLSATGYDPAGFTFSNLSSHVGTTLPILLFSVLMLITIRQRLLAECLGVFVVGLSLPGSVFFHITKLAMLFLLFSTTSQQYFKERNPQDYNVLIIIFIIIIMAIFQS